ncbi:MAG: hypothetical protein R3C43_01655 [Chloroflexota bacterium]
MMKPLADGRADRIARIETKLWEAYYNREWLREFRLLVNLHREFFRMKLPAAILASYDAARAAMVFAPLDTSDRPAARRHLVRYYTKVRRSLGCKAEATDLAERELHYWVVHRQVAGRRLAQVNDGRPIDDPDLTELEPVSDAFARLHAGLFNSTPEIMRESGVYRAQAAAVVDRISGRYSPDVAADWGRVEAYLRLAYRAIEAATQGAESYEPSNRQP